MAPNMRSTTDHDEIRKWVKARNGQPASVRDTESGEPADALRIDFPGGSSADRLEHISWDDWFRKFDNEELAFLYQEPKPDGEDITFFKLVARD